jgi:membrane-associated phospholipid phosphatase
MPCTPTVAQILPFPRRGPVLVWRVLFIGAICTAGCARSSTLSVTEDSRCPSHRFAEGPIDAEDDRESAGRAFFRGQSMECAVCSLPCRIDAPSASNYDSLNRECQGGLPEVSPYSRRPLSLWDDLERWPEDLRRDALACVNGDNALRLAASLGGSLAIRGIWDDDVRQWTAPRPARWGNVSRGLSESAVGHWHLAGILGVYGASLCRQDPYLHDMSGGLLNAWMLAGAATWALKLPIDTERPDGGRHSFPSGHSSTSFALAAVVDEYYGPLAGIPAYGLAGLVGWSRIDLRRHDLSDVVFGSALGYVIGKSVARRRLDRKRRFEVLPFFDLDGTRGVMLQVDLP